MRLYHYLLLIVFSCCDSGLFAQDTIDQKTVFVIDSLPRTVVDETDQSLSMDEIHTYRRIGDKDSINKVFNIYGPDTLVFILTKMYMERPDSLKKIPSLSALHIKENKYYKGHDALPYSGNFIETYLNGAKRFTGTIVNGEITGYASIFYPDGALKFSAYYRHNQQDGMLEEYFPNGNLKRRGEMSEGKLNGMWQIWFSSGELKETQRFIFGNSLSIQGTGEFYAAYGKAKAYISRQAYSDALRSLRECLTYYKGMDYVYGTQGVVYLQLNNPGRALEAYNKAIELEPMEPEYYIGRALAALNLIEANKANLSKLKNLKELQQMICTDYKKALSLGEKSIPQANVMKAYCNN